jgi:hypothetical protein
MRYVIYIYLIKLLYVQNIGWRQRVVREELKEEIGKLTTNQYIGVLACVLSRVFSGEAS